MCTVTWTRETGGFQLFSNRDENVTRAPATRVQLLSSQGVRYVAPLDGHRGGAWLAANEFGLCISLLNGRGPARAPTSRGLLVLDLIPARSVNDVGVRLTRRDLTEFTPFTLIALDLHSPAAVLEWDGENCTLMLDRGSQGLLSSSSFDYDGVAASRRDQFTRLTQRFGTLHTGHLLAFHRSHEPERGPYSACMHRQGACTVSFSWLTVKPAQVDFFYAPGPPCSSLAGETTTLKLRPQEEGACLACC